MPIWREEKTHDRRQAKSDKITEALSNPRHRTPEPTQTADPAPTSVLSEANVEATIAKLQIVEADLSSAVGSETPARDDRHRQPNFWPPP